MRVGGTQQRRRDAERGGTAAHVADDVIALGAGAVRQVVVHRGVVGAALLGQHLADLLAIGGAHGIAGSRGDRLGLGKQLEDQRRTVVGRGEVADGAAHQAVHAGHRRDHHELFPHIEHHVLARRGTDFRVYEFGADRLRPCAGAAGSLAEGDARELVVMADAAVGPQTGADIGDPAEDRLGPERGGEPVEMDEPVQHRQNRRPRPDRRSDRLDRLVEVVMLRGQQDQIVRPAGPVGGGDLRLDREVAERARHLEALLAKQRRARRADEKRHVAARLGRPPPPRRAPRQNSRRPRRLPIRGCASPSYLPLRAVTIASPRSMSSAWVSCSSSEPPRSPEATDERVSCASGGVAASGAGGPGAPGDAACGTGGAACAGADDGPTGSVFFSAPRKSASRRPKPWAIRSSLTGATTTSGSSPFPWMARPLGVTKRAVVNLIAPLPFSGISVSIALTPKVLVPTHTARWLSCSAPATSSASLAVPPLTRATIGNPLVMSPGVAAMCLAWSVLRPLTIATSPLSRKSSAAATATSKLPPGSLRRSRTKPASLLPACCDKSCTAAVSAACVPSSNPAMRI